MAKSMRAVADEIRAEIGATDEAPAEVALRIAQDLSIEFPNSTAAGRQRAAAAAAGAEAPPTDAEMSAAITEVDDRRPSRRAKRAASSAGARSKRRLSRAAKRSRPASPFTISRSPRDLFFQSLGLVVLYWVIRTPDIVGTVAGGVQRSFGWLASTRGIAGGGASSESIAAAMAAYVAPQFPDVIPDAPAPGGALTDEQLEQLRQFAEGGF